MKGKIWSSLNCPLSQRVKESRASLSFSPDSDFARPNLNLTQRPARPRLNSFAILLNKQAFILRWAVSLGGGQDCYFAEISVLFCLNMSSD
jgi:hypothetical protein